MEILRDSSKVLTGITVQRVMSFIMIPVIARLLGPKDYGIFNVAASVCALLAVSGGFALEASIAVAVTKKQAAERTIGIFLIGILSGILFGFIAYLIHPHLKNYYSADITNALLFMIPVFVPLGIINVSAQNYAGYLGKFKFFAIADITSPIAGYITLISVYFLFWGDYRSLIASGIITLVVRIGAFLYASKGSELFHKDILSTEVSKSLWQARNFTKFNLPSNLLNTATVQLPPILLSTVFSESVVGLFTMARNIITIPTNLSGKALGQVFYPKAAEEYRNTGSLTEITWRTFVYSCQLTLFPAIFTAAAAGFVLPLLLGPRWAGVTPFLLLLLPMVLLNAVQTQIGIGFIFSILSQQYKILIGNVLLFVFRISPLLICIFLKCSEYLTILSYSVGGAIGYGLLLAWIFIATSISVTTAFYTWARYCFIAALCVLPVLGATLLSSQILLLMSSLVITTTIYCIIVLFNFMNGAQRSLVKSKIYGIFSLNRMNSKIVKG